MQFDVTFFLIKYISLQKYGHYKITLFYNTDDINYLTYLTVRILITVHYTTLTY